MDFHTIYVIWSLNQLVKIIILVFNHFAIAHSSVDDHLVRWFGLNQSKYQWALDEYYEGKGSVSVS